MLATKLLVTVLAMATASSLLGVGMADAATEGVAEVADGTLRYPATSGDAHVIVITGVDGTYTVNDVVPIVPGPGCRRVSVDDPTIVRCSGSPRIVLVNVTGGELDDFIDNATNDTRSLTEGRGGIDRIFGTPNNDNLSGGQDDDRVRGEGGRDVVTGRAGNDTLFGDDGDDLMSGGPGNDALSGNNGNDTLFGDGENDQLDGGSGTNELDGGPGSDTCVNGPTIRNCP